MQIKYTKDALKFLQKQPKASVGRIRQAIAKLTLSPPQGDTTILQGYSDGRRRLRVGSLRVIYRYALENGTETLLIIDIGSRGDIYK